MTDVVSTVIGQTLGDKYRVRRLIGSGGMGAVYEVEHTFSVGLVLVGGSIAILSGAFRQQAQDGLSVDNPF